MAGKSSGRSGFVRQAAQNRVYSVDFDLRTEAGLYGDETDKVPEAKPWLNLQLHDVPKDQVTGVELQLPERRLKLALKKPEPEKPAEKKAEDGEAASEAKPDAPANASEAKPEWELVEPKVSYALKQGVVEGLVSTLRALRGDDVVAPDKMAEYGLDSPPYRAVLTVEEEGKDEPRQVAVAVGNTVSEEDEKRYVRLEQDNSPVYVLPQWSFNQVFPTLGTILVLDVLSLEPDDVVRMSWEQEGQSLALERQLVAAANTSTSTGADASKSKSPAEGAGEEKPAESEAKAESGEEKAAEPEAKQEVWRWVQAPDVDVDADKLKALLDSVERLTADDWFADVPDEAGLDQPVLVLTVTLRNGATYQAAFGQTRGKDEDRYVSLQDKEGIFVVAKTSYTSIADALKPLRPEAPAPAEAPASETMPKPEMTAPKPEMASPAPVVKPSSEEPTMALPKPSAVQDTQAVIKMPMETQPTPLSVPQPPTVEGPSTEDTSANQSPGTETTTPVKNEKQ
ncbi:DUF4340 domain-containing protein [Candidatus Entotheonella palauensis]|uniref:DUF4340 domain-containing protein n=1 Tax=Candidatus Entotheonella palauensis TaxID=93172 RepID=UPI0004B8608F|nr:DUF4340 domain-containing protein [Candidatus Entotheonella palauensis]